MDKGASEGFEAVEAAGGTGVSLTVVGEIVNSPAKGQEVELKVSQATVHGQVDAAKYPLAKKRHTMEKLRELQHLRPRTNAVRSSTAFSHRPSAHVCCISLER